MPTAASIGLSKQRTDSVVRSTVPVDAGAADGRRARRRDMVTSTFAEGSALHGIPSSILSERCGTGPQQAPGRAIEGAPATDCDGALVSFDCRTMGSPPLSFDRSRATLFEGGVQLGRTQLKLRLFPRTVSIHRVLPHKIVTDQTPASATSVQPDGIRGFLATALEASSPRPSTYTARVRQATFYGHERVKLVSPAAAPPRSTARQNRAMASFPRGKFCGPIDMGASSSGRSTARIEG